MATAVDMSQPSLADRVKRIITDPKNEWPVIEAEQTTIEKLYREYIIILAAIPAVAGLVANVFIGSPGLFGWSRMSLVAGLATAVITYVLTLVGVFIGGFVVDKLAPTFDSQPNQMQALKLVAYAYTPSWVAGAATVIPVLGSLVMLVAGLYCIYVFYLGLPVMMKTPEAKVIPYMLVAAIVIIVVSVILWIGAGLMMAPFLLLG